MTQVLELKSLAPDPGDEWRRMLAFVGLDHADLIAMAGTVEPLFRRGPELVVDTYNYLNSVPETAAILGWESGVDEDHLEERRRFFTVWLARTLGLDIGEAFGHYLFRAGKFHAAHGPRQIHTPPAYVTTSMGLVQSYFARFLAEANLSANEIAQGMAGWTKYFSVQLHLMLLGYQVARDFDHGHDSIMVSLFGRLRPLVGRAEVEIRAEKDADVESILTKFFDYYPKARVEALDRTWASSEKPDSLWVDVHPLYALRKGWRILLNGRDVEYEGGFGQVIQPGNKIAIFPPGR